MTESTLFEDERKLRYLGRILDDFEQRGIISSSAPEHMRAEDIKKVLEWFRKNDLAPSTQEKYLNHLNGLLRFCKNRVIDDMKIEGVRLPKGQHKPINCIEETDLAKIQSTASEIDGWIGTVADFIVNIYPATGLRPKELRLAQLDDINVKKWEMLVRHPKGEKSWGEQRTVIILPQAREATIKYLAARKKYLSENGLSAHPALIPNIHSEGGYYSSNWFRVTKKLMEQRAGVPFKLKDFRPTFAQMLVDIDPNLLPDVSAILGHSTISTTQEYYAQIKGGDARRRLGDAMTKKINQSENVRSSPEPNFQDKQKKALMGSKEYLSGYY